MGLGGSLPGSSRATILIVGTGLVLAFLLLLLIRMAWTGGAAGQLAGLALVAGGGIGNWLDRLLQDGVVTDFMTLGQGWLRTGVFNLADVAIFGGIIVMVLARPSRPRVPAKGAANLEEPAMDLIPLLDELQTIARNGLNYATDPFDRERYSRLMELATRYYAQALALPPAEAQQRLAGELGHITPKVGADAAIFDEQGRILLQQRADNGRWCLPCGWVEPHETTAEAAVREAWEETGLEVRVAQLVDVVSRFASAWNGPHAMVAVVYLCEVVGGSLRRSDEGLDVAYWLLDDVPVWHANHESYARLAHQLWQERQSGRPEPVEESPSGLLPPSGSGG
jgi:8-oxo-dGTP pyrophosphatase MutT (NUDIX family)